MTIATRLQQEALDLYLEARENLKRVDASIDLSKATSLDEWLGLRSRLYDAKAQSRVARQVFIDICLGAGSITFRYPEGLESFTDDDASYTVSIHVPKKE